MLRATGAGNSSCSLSSQRSAIAALISVSTVAWPFSSMRLQVRTPNPDLAAASSWDQFCARRPALIDAQLPQQFLVRF